MEKNDIRSLSMKELEELMEQFASKSFHGKQIS